MGYKLVSGNIIGLISSLILLYSGTLIDKRQILLTDIVREFISILGNMALGGFTACVTSFVGIIKNVLCYTDHLSLKAKIIIAFLTIFFSRKINNLGCIGLLPVIVSIIHLCFMETKSIKKFKLLNACSTTSWIVYKIFIKSYLSAGFEILILLVNLATIRKINDSENI